MREVTVIYCSRLRYPVVGFARNPLIQIDYICACSAKEKSPFPSSTRTKNECLKRKTGSPVIHIHVFHINEGVDAGENALLLVVCPKGKRASRLLSSAPVSKAQAQSLI